MSNKLATAELFPSPSLAIDNSQISMVNKFYFFEKIGFWTALKLWMKSFLSDEINHIHYIDLTSWAKYLIKKLQSKKVLFKSFEFRLADIKDPKGDLENLNTVYIDGPAFKKVVLDDIKPSLNAIEKVSKPLRVYIEKATLYEGQLVLDSYHRAMFLIRLISWYCREQHIPIDKVVLNLNYRGWQSAFQKTYAHINFKIQFCKIPFVNKQVIGKLIRLSLGNKIFAALKLKAILKSQTQTEFQATPQSKIFVKTLGSANFTQPKHNSDVFFCFDTDIHPQEVVVAVDTQLPDINQVITATHSAGACPLITNPDFAKDHRSFLASYIPKSRLPFSKQEQSLLQQQPASNRHAKQYSLTYDRWHQFFKQSHSKVYFEWYKYDNTHIPVGQAINDLGGHSVIYQRAYEEFACNEFSLFCDLGLFWSETGLKAALDAGSHIKYGIVIGYLKDYCFSAIRKDAGHIKNQLRQNHATTILSYYDEGSSADHRWHTGHSFMRENYRFLFEKVLENDWLGLVIKPKLPRTLASRLGNIASLMDEAVATGRCHIFSDQQGHGSSYPVAYAAWESDFAIHGHLCAGSAGIEAALAGVPTLFIDREGWQKSKLQDLGPHVTFQTWDSLWEAVQDHHKSSNPHLGIWPKDLLMEHDPYLDGKTNQRLGTLLRSLLDGHKQHAATREAILEQTITTYKSRWGEKGIFCQ